jgi:ubiquinone/menaquinone biosynthesis C-methylase UbiE
MGTRRTSTVALLFAALNIGFLSASQATQPVDTETKRLIEELALQPGMVVADIGVGEGKQTLELARYVGPDGRVYGTDVNSKFLAAVEEVVKKEGLQNVVTILGDPNRTNLPDNCCDSMLIRNVYHHFADPSAMNRSLLAGLKPGGRLIVIDFPPDNDRFYPPADRARGDGHGVIASAVDDELKAAGFEVLRTIANWSGRAFAVVALRAK